MQTRWVQLQKIHVSYSPAVLNSNEVELLQNVGSLFTCGYLCTKSSNCLGFRYNQTASSCGLVDCAAPNYAASSPSEKADYLLASLGSDSSVAKGL